MRWFAARGADRFNQMSFTPLVSPAVTPLETHFPVDNPFTVPGSYFSPLTSPALHAQNDPSNAIFERRLGATNASTPEETGPETTIGPAPSTLPAPVVTKPGKTTRRSNPRSRSKVAVGMSPISKPQRRKAATTPKLNAQALAELVGSAAPSREPRAVFTPVVAIMTNASSTAGATDSENGSISPEALTDTAFQEMPPPPVPKPRSAKPSPFMAPQKHGTPGFHPTNRHDMTSPATPASLMVLSSPGERTGGSVDGSQEALETEQMEKFELPEPVTSSRPIMTPINTKPLKSPVPTADASTNKMSGLQTLPPPAIGKLPVTILASASPPIAPASATFNPRKVPQPMPRGGNKKRSGASSVQVSPALRPKISPNFKPLLPGGATAEETASHLLATKSNYQRILEGNTVPGVSYPSELSTNLTSKRTSHKIAEQGRRNRINSALQEMAALLPRPPLKEGKGVTSDDENSGDKKDKSASGPNSKASTVEMAIEFIKQLKQEVADANRRADEAEKKLVARSDE